MPIEDRNLKPGTRLVGRYHKQPFTCEVVEGEGGKLRYRLQDGREFKSPSAAGMAITGHACDGWVFWSVETAEDASTEEAHQEETSQETESPAEDAPAAGIPETSVGEAEEQGQTDVAASDTPAEKPTPAKSPIFRLPNQKGAPEGQARWYCRECHLGFLAPVGKTPETCPKGHKVA